MGTTDGQPETIPRRAAVVPPLIKSSRLDVVLCALVTELSRTHARELIEDGRVRVEGAVARKPGAAVAVGARIEVELAPRRNLRVEHGDPAALRVVHEDEAIVVIDKPPGVLAHPTDSTSGATIADLAALRYGPLPTLQGKDRPGIVHRLDAGTSGLMVLARTAEAFADLMRQFRGREVRKTYLALVYGNPRFDSGWVHAPIERQGGDSKRMAVGAPESGREASTYYEVDSRFRDLALVRAQPRSGRTHQIRVHLTHVGLPLVGDPLYRRKGGPLFRFPPEAPVPRRQCLHASELEFAHPSTGAGVRFTTPVADDFAALLAWVREQRT